MKKTLVVIAGGTGGHVFPGLAVADELRARGWQVYWMGNPESFESQVVPKHGYEMLMVTFSALRGKGFLRLLMLPFNLLSACVQAFKQIRARRPDVVLGMGGYISFPGGMMARLLGARLVIHEQNSIPGLANRVLAKFAHRVLCGFPEALPRGRWLGNPVRQAVAALEAPEVRFAGREGPLRLLVLGGSLGAQAINTCVPQGIALIPEAERPQIVHQAGEKHLETLKQNYEAAGVHAECVGFIDDMPGAYAWADIVICRSGALTVAELAAAGLASILVPFPHAVDDHQTANAAFLTKVGGAILMPQDSMTPESISLLRNYSRAQLCQMAVRARALAKPNAGIDVANICEECV